MISACDIASSETYVINEIAKKLRKRTGLTTEQLTVNNGNLTLVGRKKAKKAS